MSQSLSEALAAITRDVEEINRSLSPLAENKELWNWAQYRAKQLGKESVFEYVCDLIREDKKKGESLG